MSRGMGIWVSPYYSLSMPTVISSVPTAEGFVIGSDGRNSDAESQTILDDDARKIFAIRRRGVNLAYGLSGTPLIGESKDSILFDFKTQIISAIDQIGSRSRWDNYLSALAGEIESRFNAALRDSGKRLNTEYETKISIGGFFGVSQKLGHISFEHGVHGTKGESHSYPDGFSFPWGCIPLFDLMNEGDPRFAKYRSPNRVGITTLASGIERVKNDILAHYDPEAIKVDENIRWQIGGRIQIATVTRSSGFQWVPGYEARSTHL